MNSLEGLRSRCSTRVARPPDRHCDCDDETRPRRVALRDIKNALDEEAGLLKTLVQELAQTGLAPALDDSILAHSHQGEHGLCPTCSDLFEATTARVVTHLCDCGHKPNGPVVFVYRPDAGPALCSAACAHQHWKKVFRFFIQRFSCAPR